ncbi:Hypothetical predicted protein [Cloeon dipterum]|uniref:histone acetyltransferase n=1 Tax=Cloeon dipterum TaxID=197152 RepID=A0A8S1CVF0_9INSE|nr:Hypothetical predicted protein [Cloeon dipterum]
MSSSPSSPSSPEPASTKIGAYCYATNQHLSSLLHAQKCGHKQTQTQSGMLAPECPHPDCMEMKDVLNHMLICMNGEFCEKDFCASSKMILSHWMECTEQNCPLCSPSRQIYQVMENLDEVEPVLSRLSKSLDGLRDVLKKNKEKHNMQNKFQDMETFVKNMALGAESSERSFNPSCMIDIIKKYDLMDTNLLRPGSPGKLSPYQQQQALLLIGFLWNRRQSDTNETQNKCSHLSCRVSKKNFNHVKTCDKGIFCGVPQCVSTREIVDHWHQFEVFNCLVCAFVANVNEIVSV